jgi:hypothetical protein
LSAPTENNPKTSLAELFKEEQLTWSAMNRPKWVSEDIPNDATRPSSPRLFRSSSNPTMGKKGRGFNEENAPPETDKLRCDIYERMQCRGSCALLFDRTI